MITLKKLNDVVKMDPLLQREIEAYIKFSTDIETEEKNNLIDELPERLRNRLSILLFEKHKQRVAFFTLCASNQNFIKWIVPKLTEFATVEGGYMQ